MCIQNLVLIGLFVFKILSNSDVNQGPLLCCKLSEIRSHPSFHACSLTCKNEVDQIKNERARVFTRFLPL